MTSAAHESLIARERPAYDGAEPSGTSIALMNAARLGAYTDQDRWRVIAERALAAHARTLVERPIAMTEALLALDFLRGDPCEVVIVWPDGLEAGGNVDAGAVALRDTLRQTFLPARVLACGTASEVAALGRLLPFARGKLALGGAATAYVCRRGRCELPVTQGAALAAELRRPLAAPAPSQE